MLEGNPAFQSVFFSFRFESIDQSNASDPFLFRLHTQIPSHKYMSWFSSWQASFVIEALYHFIVGMTINIYCHALFPHALFSLYGMGLDTSIADWNPPQVLQDEGERYGQFPNELTRVRISDMYIRRATVSAP
jgi:hypothetical protein